MAARGFRVGRAPVHHIAAAADGTAKVLLLLEDSRVVEAVGIPAEGDARGTHRLTACISSQVRRPFQAWLHQAHSGAVNPGAPNPRFETKSPEFVSFGVARRCPEPISLEPVSVEMARSDFISPEFLGYKLCNPDPISPARMSPSSLNPRPLNS